MQLQVGDVRVGIRLESLIWFTILTAVGTILGGIGYAYLEQYLPGLPQNAVTKGSKPAPLPYNPATPSMPNINIGLPGGGGCGPTGAC